METGEKNILDEAQTIELRRISSMIAKGDPLTNINASWELFLNGTLPDLAREEIPTDVNNFVQHVLREAYLESANDLRVYAEKVRYYNEKKREMRNEILKIRESTERYISSLESMLDTAEDDAQLANIDLQSTLQKTQQTLQSMSNISKMLQDTAMAIIRKIG